MTGPILPVTLDIHTLRSSMVDYRINSNIIRQNAQTPIWSITSDIKAQVSHEQKVSLTWQYGWWSFQTGDTILETFLPKNQHIQRKLLNFENWVSGEVSKIGHHFSK